MHYPSLHAVIFGLSALVGTTSASVSLASFIPRIDSLPSQCASVYNSKIDGCTADDFKQQATCSNACVQGLVKTTEAVNRSCEDVDVGETSIIGVFQSGLGIQSLCPGVTVTTISPTSSSTEAPVQTSTKAAASTTVTTVTTSTSETPNVQSSSTSTGGIIVDPSATSTLLTSAVNAPPAPSSTQNSNSASPSRVANSQLSNANSGGGSPFDVVATASSSQLRVTYVSMAALFATALLFVACA